jgi:hypothetical protein
VAGRRPGRNGAGHPRAEPPGQGRGQTVLPSSEGLTTGRHPCRTTPRHAIRHPHTQQRDSVGIPLRAATHPRPSCHPAPHGTHLDWTNFPTPPPPTELAAPGRRGCRSATRPRSRRPWPGSPAPRASRGHSPYGSLPDGRIALSQCLTTALAAAVAPHLVPQPGRAYAQGGDAYTPVSGEVVVEVVADTTRHAVVTVVRLR